MTALNPVMRCGDQIDEVLATHTALPAAERRAKVLGDHPRGGAARSGADDGVVSAPALRRPAATDHDRDGAGARAGAADRRRADHGARRHHAGADSRADPRAHARARHGCAVHHARLRRGGGNRGPRGGAADRRPRGDRGHARVADGAAARLHEDADRGRAEPHAEASRDRDGARRGHRARIDQDVCKSFVARRTEAHGGGGRRRVVRHPPRRDRRPRGRVGVGQDRRSPGASRGWSSPPVAGSSSATPISRRSRARNCTRCAARCRSCSRIRIGRSIRGAPWAPRLSRGR